MLLEFFLYIYTGVFLSKNVSVSIVELLETPESPTHFSDLRLLLPSLGDLAQRLKPKLVQDPMLDEEGKPYTYLNMSK